MTRTAVNEATAHIDHQHGSVSSSGITAAASDEEQAVVAGERKQNDPPDGGYGWVCVICCFLINAHTWGINSSYGVFLSYYLANNYYPGATSLEFAFVGGLSISQALMVSPIATSTTRLYGTRITLLIGVAFETLALIGASFTHKIWQLFLSQGVCFGFGMGFMFVGSVGVVPQWFTKKRSLANGVATGGSGIGGMMYSLATNAMIESLGVEWAFRILGILAFVVNFVCAILIKDRNKAIGTTQLAFDHRLFRRAEFLLVLGWGIFSMFGSIAPVGAEVVGLRELPSALSITWLILVIPTTFSEPIALELRQNGGDVYLHAQIFAGFMYVGAASCMWFLRAWKIGEIRQSAPEQEKPAIEVGTMPAQTEMDLSRVRHTKAMSSIFKRLFGWKRV
ncbi:MAG: hypothetical protein Q9191_004907 [Dirinaria sp. TL-2023a]